MRVPTRRRILLAAAAVLSVVWAFGGATISASHGWDGDHLLQFLCPLAYLWSGLFAIHRGAGKPIGALLIGYGVILPLGYWAIFSPPLVEALSAVPDGTKNVLLVHIALVYPTGRVASRFARTLVVAAYAWSLAINTVVESTIDRSVWQCDPTHYCRATLSLWLWPSWGVEMTAWKMSHASNVIFVVLIAAALWQRRRMSTAAERIALRPIWIALALLGGATSAASVGGGLGYLPAAWSNTLGDLQLFAQLVVPIVIVYGLVHSQLVELASRNAALAETVQAQLQDVRASRARIVAAGDAERRRVEHDLHDGAQQRLLSVVVALRLAEQAAEQGTAGTATAIAEAGAELRTAIDELRDLARGIHPSVLTDAGLGEAVRALARRSAVPVTELVVIEERLPADVEATGYFVVAEALANVVKHAQASQTRIRVTREAQAVRIEVVDDGRGGASETGAGLQGLADRVAAVGGRLTVSSPPGAGTILDATILLDATIPVVGAEVSA